MPVFLPFRAYRPQKDKVAKFSAKTADFSSQEEVIEEMHAHPESYFHVTKQHLLDNGKKSVEHYFEKGAAFFKSQVENNNLFRDKVPCFYVYRQIDPVTNKIFTGIIGLADVHDLELNTIKKHELTKVVREEYLYKQMHYTGVLGEPVLLGYPHSEEIQALIEATMVKEPEYQFVTIDKKEHTVWLINTSVDLEKLTELCAELPAFYIADGHHRCASTIRNYERFPVPINRYFMVYLLDENQFNIGSFHRLLSDFDFNEKCRQGLEEYFNVEDYTPGELFIPTKHSEFGLLTREYSLKLMLKHEPRTHNPEAHLDVSILENKLFKPILDIHHPRTDHRLSYMSASEDMQNVKRLIADKEVDVVISNFPVTFSEVKQVADANKSMPPKSTYIEPKLRGGMIIQKF